MQTEVSEEIGRHQMIFDWIVTHLRVQGRKSFRLEDGIKRNRYHHVLDDGTILMCAVGCLISKEHYKPDFENKDPGFHVEITQAAEKSMGIGISGRDICLILSMWQIHDRVNVEKWEEMFKKTAFVHDVEYRPVIFH